MSSSLSNATSHSKLTIEKFYVKLSRAIITYSEVLSVLELALADKGSIVVSAGFIDVIIDEAYKNTAYSFKYLCIAFDEYYNAISQ
jgi:hypothetical protein